MTKAQFSLVIPTFDRAPILRRCVANLLQLDGIAACEIIVVDDGSTDETAAVLEQFRQAAPQILKVHRIENGGPARARNHGLREAKNDRILFVDDDVFPRQGMLESHWEKLNAGYAGSQGLLLWHEEIPMDRLLAYIDSRGSQFAFDRVEDPDDMGFEYVYTGNFAVLKSAALAVGGFDEGIFTRKQPLAAFEDTILGYRLKQNGAKLALNKGAIADHLHGMDEKEFLRREYKVGYIIGVMLTRHPEMAKSLGLESKDVLVAPQVRLLRAINAIPLVERLLGYPLSMRLRHREAFYSGFLQFKKDTKSQRAESNRAEIRKARSTL